MKRCFGWCSSGAGAGAGESASREGGGGSVESRDGLLWHTDLKPHSSGDFSIAVVQANDSLEDQGQVLASSSATYFGVFDGHGGLEASRFVNSRLFAHLHGIDALVLFFNGSIIFLFFSVGFITLFFAEFASEQGGLSVEVIRKAFTATEEEFLQLVKQSWRSRPKIASAESCCLVGAIADNVLYVANLGDSRAVLGRQGADGGAVVAERLSRDHNVVEKEVRRELTELHPDDSRIVTYNRGAWRIKGTIQVSRSIGDVYLKKSELSGDALYQKLAAPVPLKQPVVTTEPSIRIRDLKQNNLFLIFASDDLWEHLSDEAP
ncbi:hypothetical protein ZIOFF_069532 [Zingiber officinale]|uniref:protein-serine/threonine phosphatase n=1 Tax=Zingiber officinale TaxID=94328 RepID=A0A8J5CBU5_ZINOF|nr:hypothetical protein ZIOFF_069532 [Zingiber officinale]